MKQQVTDIYRIVLQNLAQGVQELKQSEVKRGVSLNLFHVSICINLFVSPYL